MLKKTQWGGSRGGGGWSGVGVGSDITQCPCPKLCDFFFTVLGEPLS